MPTPTRKKSKSRRAASVAEERPARQSAPHKAKNSLVDNINRRKRAGTSRPKSRSTVSSAAYERMEAGWSAKSKKKSRSAKPRAKKKALTQR